MFQIWFKIFYRNSKKNWLNVLVNILGLALGFTTALIVLAYLNDEQSYNSSNPQKDNIYRVIHRMSNGGVGAHSTIVEGVTYKEEIPEISDYYISPNWYYSELVKVNGKNQFSENILKGSANFFDFFPFKIIEGSQKKFSEARNNIAISEEQARIFFDNKSPIGKTIEFLNRVFTVTTVYKIVGKHYYMPNMIIQYKNELLDQDWENLGVNLFVKVAEETNQDDIEKKASDVWYKNYVLPFSKKEGITPEEFVEKQGIIPYLESIEDIRLKTVTGNAGPEGKGSYQLILIMLSLSILIIIISYVNLINLSIATASQRGKEVGIKKTLGLTKTKLIMQYVLEIVIQGLIAFMFSLLLLELIMPSFNLFMSKSISLYKIDLLIKFLLFVILASAIIGVIPSIYLSKYKTVEVLKGNVSRNKQGVIIRNLMLGIQFLVSGFFLASSIIINQQVNYMENKDLGFNGEQVLMIPMNENDEKYNKYLLAKKELTKHPNIEDVTSNLSIIGGGMGMGARLDYKGTSVRTSLDAIDYNFLKALNIEVLKGRDFKEEIASDTIKNILINEALAKTLNIYNDPIGKEIPTSFGGYSNVTMKVIGMVKDYNVDGLDTKIRPTVFLHWNGFDFMKSMLSTIQIKIKPDNLDNTLNFIEDYWSKNVEQGYPYNPTFLNKRFAKTYKKYLNQKTLFFILTVIVIIISLLGLFASATLTIEQRLKEVAIRKTLGASVQEIILQLIKSFMKVVVVASVFLIPMAYYFMQGWLDNFIYRINMPLLPYIVTPVVLMVLVFLVVGLKAFNATKVDLIKYLKFE
ncbi:FtsX-like permease family protein [Tenacibaculum aiptasiae]|uniref:FtsX-like permease family protein n=1 Tax=Tenacibaculum aiptasiae TaxID=426481 RepID=A0A7J5AP91_9FLAO|nr:ABC transporter permease [Tenacibaculum aiptasiae]KAB1159367.1 FtsX-like permease family protein [Tenacibaculum aiptasiae]